MKKIISSTLVCFICIVCISAKRPIKFGKVSMADLKMETYDLDTSAAAVVLCDYGEFDPDRIMFSRNLRIKILKKDGLQWANISAPTGEKGLVNGYTFNLVNGKIVKTKLDKKEDVYRERVIDDRYRLRISMPNVKVGSVIDIEYAFDGMPYVWTFQDLIPTKHSELIIYDNPYFTFSKNFFGFERFDIQESGRWVMTDVPAFKKESYMNNYENYISKVEIEVSQITIASMGIHKSYSTSWESIQKNLYESQNFGGKMSGNYFLKDIGDEINSKYSTEKEKIAAAVTHIKKVKWDEKKRLTCSSYSLSNRYENKLANSAELNIMLIELLDKMGFDSKPIVLSTRDNGLLSFINPSLYKLNYVIAYVKTDSGEYYLDATDKYLHPLALPEHCLNYQGRILAKDLNSWQNINPSFNDSKQLFYNLTIDSTGQISGSFNCKYSGYASRDARARHYAFSSEEDFIIDFEKRNNSISVEDFKFEGLDDPLQDIIEKYQVKIDNSGNNIGSMILLNPLFEEQLAENPFKLNERKYPVDFIHNINRTVIINIELPDNAIIEELPKPLRLEMPEKSISAIYNVVQLGNRIQVMYKFDTKKTLFNEAEYAYIKQFYASLVEKHAENIIINLSNNQTAQN